MSNGNATLQPKNQYGQNDPFYNLERILNGEQSGRGQTVALQEPVRATTTQDALSGLRPSVPAAAPTKKDTQWSELETEIASFSTNQRQYTEDFYQKSVAPLQGQRSTAQVPSMPLPQHSQDISWDQEIASAPSVPSPNMAGGALRSKAGLKTIGSILGVAVVLIVGIFGYRSLSGGSKSNEPKVVRANTTQPKTAVNPAETPKSVIERAPVNGQSTVVARDERPLSPAEQNLQNTNARIVKANPDQIEEPRKVRTVSITPDGQTRAAMPSVPAAVPMQVSAANMQNIQPRTVRAQTINMNSNSAAPAVAAPTQPRVVESAPSRASTVAAPKPAPRVVQPTPEPRQVAPVAVAQATPGRKPLALGPNAVNDETPAAPTRAVSSGGGSGTHVVQVGTASSAEEARSKFRQMQGKFSSLKGQSVNVVEAEVNGNTVYRMRLGAMSKDGATEFCSSLKSSGGACFVAGR